MDERNVTGNTAEGRVIENPWQSLRAVTPARIALGRVGVSLPTRHHLAFQLAHARARDAVHSALDVGRLRDELRALGGEPLVVTSAAGDRPTYLQRPDLGRRLAPGSVDRVPRSESGTFDVAFVVADGLSALAVQQHAVPLLRSVLSRLDTAEWKIAPTTIVEQGRVAISDEIGWLLDANLAVILIGERPGLSSPDSLGIYLTHRPRIGNSDAERNCISNIHAAGLNYAAAADRLVFLMAEARRRRISGVMLKDHSGLQQLSTPRDADGVGV